LNLQPGPLFWFETIRQSRLSSGHWARLIFCSIFLFILYIIFGRDDLTAGRLPKLAENCAAGYVTLQYFAVLLLTPVFIVSSIIEDRQKRVFEILLTTHVTSQEILLGKLFSRLVHVLIVLASGIPVLAMLQVLGGVNMAFVLWHTCLALLLMIIVGCIALRASLWASSSFTGILLTWLLMLPCIGFAFVPSYLVGMILENITSLSPWAMGLLGALIFNTWLVIRLMRDAVRAVDNRTPTLLELERLSHPRRLAVSVPTNDESGRAMAARLAEREVRHRREHFSYTIAPLSDHPLRWLEENFPPLERGFWLPFGFLILPVTLATFCSSNLFFFVFMKMLAVYYWYLISVHIATSLAQDRFLHRLDAVLMMPGETAHLLMERLLGTCRRYGHLLFNIILGFCLMTFFQPPHHWWLFPVFLSQVFLWCAFGCWVGLQPVSTFIAKQLTGSTILLAALAGFYCFDLLGVQLGALPVWIQLIIGLICSWAVWSAIQHSPDAAQLALALICLNILLACILFWRSVLSTRSR